ncbi:carboxylesterase family protein [Aquisediminimonas profunda]|uniref:carboxylesterase family protein n=1 Tax=Aquisediminimonas profunda TaxID=1550733 RepID=UPI003CCEB443
MLGLVGFTVSARTPLPQPSLRVESGDAVDKRLPHWLAFLGIPYGGDTGGANRWTPPVAAKAWSGSRDATQFSADCQQDPPYSPPGRSPWSAPYLPSAKMSENCLFFQRLDAIGKGALAGNGVDSRRRLRRRIRLCSDL